MNSNSETKLVEAAQNGCVESFGILYERYYIYMTALAFSILANRELAEDAAQETFAVACDKIGTLKNKNKFASWIASICRNVSRQMLRTRRIKLVAFENDYEVPFSQEIRNELPQIAIKKALENLKDLERELIVMRYFDNFSYCRIASVLNISEQAVHGRLIRTKRKIAKYLKRNGITGDNYE